MEAYIRKETKLDGQKILIWYSYMSVVRENQTTGKTNLFSQPAGAAYENLWVTQLLLPAM